MPFRIEILPEYVHVEWYGNLVNSDLFNLGMEMPRIGEQLRRAPNVLHTFEGVETVKLEVDAMQAHGRKLARTVLPNPSRTASFCDRPLVYGVARMMQSLNTNPMLQMEVFSSREEAIAWLRQPL